MIKVANWLTHIEYDWESPVWSPLLQQLAERCRLIRYDGRGNGLADRDVADISFAAFVRDLETVVDADGAGTAAFLGISQGAAVAIAYAVRHPERVSKLILYGGYAQGRNKRGSAGRGRYGEGFLAIMRHGWGDEHSAFMKAFSSYSCRTDRHSRSNGSPICSASRPRPKTPRAFAMPATIST